jgi:hypothetical protein
MKRLVLLLVVFITVLSMSACGNPFESSADRVADNLSKQAEEFRVLRNIKLTNGITDTLLFEGIGFCSVETAQSAAAGMLEVTCKTGEDSFTKDFFFLSDNINVAVVQLEGYDVPQYHKQFIFAAEALIPHVEFTGSGQGD